MVNESEQKIASIAPFALRMQRELRTRIEEAARANRRSVNSEIVARLAASFGDVVPLELDNMPPGEPSIADFEKRLAAVEQSVLQWLFTWSPEQDARVKRIEAKLGLERPLPPA